MIEKTAAVRNTSWPVHPVPKTATQPSAARMRHCTRERRPAYEPLYDRDPRHRRDHRSVPR